MPKIGESYCLYSTVNKSSLLNLTGINVTVVLISTYDNRPKIKQVPK